MLQRTIEVRDDFIELASKLTALNAVVTNYNKPADTNLQERLEAIAMCVSAGGCLHCFET